MHHEVVPIILSMNTSAIVTAIAAIVDFQKIYISPLTIKEVSLHRHVLIHSRHRQLFFKTKTF